MTPLVTVNNLVKTYGTAPNEVHALCGASMEIRAGEVLVLMGPSGSGKTTLISILGGILTATSGSVQIAGREIVGLPEKELPKIRKDLLGFIFQGFNLFPALTAQENVDIMCKLKGVKNPKETAKELL
jgi:putative ABC transport system ATP-binding protein